MSTGRGGPVEARVVDLVLPGSRLPNTVHGLERDVTYIRHVQPRRDTTTLELHLRGRDVAHASRLPTSQIHPALLSTICAQLENENVNLTRPEYDPHHPPCPKTRPDSEEDSEGHPIDPAASSVHDHKYLM